MIISLVERYCCVKQERAYKKEDTNLHFYSNEMRYLHGFFYPVYQEVHIFHLVMNKQQHQDYQQNSSMNSVNHPNFYAKNVSIKIIMGIK